MPKFGEWTSTKEQMPESGQFVIAKNIRGTVEGGCQYRDGWFVYCGQVFADVVSWMPLPE